MNATILPTLMRSSAPLTATGLLMLPVLAGALIGLQVDDRLVLGAPVWLKPAKFALSIAIYTLSLAWVMTYLPDWTRTRRVVGWITAVTLVLEIGIIGTQAARGTTSHFNVGTPLDTVLWVVMGTAIIVQTLASVGVAGALWQQPFGERALGRALRLGLTFTIAGALIGGLMTRPTAAQLESASETRMTVAGAHTVGGEDGGPGLPGTNWSVEHGDLRVPHFIGLHALQTFALLLLLMPVRWTDARRARVIGAVASSYAALFAILLWQALRGESIAAPGALTLAVLALWTVATLVTVYRAARERRRPFAASAAMVRV
jgi:hypothetical protein